MFVGSENGEIRLYNDVGKNAKNMFVGMGGYYFFLNFFYYFFFLDPIFFTDTTKDGKWILCTCKKYLIFLPAIYGPYNIYNKKIKYEDR